jgi:hypothetical protein
VFYKVDPLRLDLIDAFETSVLTSPRCVTFQRKEELKYFVLPARYLKVFFHILSNALRILTFKAVQSETQTTS